MEQFNHFSKIAGSIRPVAKQVVRKVAFDAQANIQSQIQANNQIDTGFMFNSVYTVTSDSSSYKGGDKALAEVSKPGSETEAYVAVAAEYAIYQNYGTAHIPPRPFFEPGIERTKPEFEKAMDLIKDKMEKASG